jgi:hypothetical protein
LFINWTLRMSDNLPERVQILCHAHIIYITVLEHRIICCQIFCDLLLKSVFEWIFNVMQLILVQIKWHIKWKYLIQKFHDICLSYYFKYGEVLSSSCLLVFHWETFLKERYFYYTNSFIHKLLPWEFKMKLVMWHENSLLLFPGDLSRFLAILFLVMWCTFSQRFLNYLVFQSFDWVYLMKIIPETSCCAH